VPYSNDGGIDYMTHPNLIIILIIVDIILMLSAKRIIGLGVFGGLLLLTWIGFVYDYGFGMEGIPHEKVNNIMGVVYTIFPWMIWSFLVYGVYSNVINFFKRYKS
jgi:hypothetical protein